MLNTVQQKKIDIMSQRTMLSVVQAKACDALLATHQNIAFFKLYALGDAQGLSTQQWMRALKFITEYEALRKVADENTVHSLLQTHDNFLAYDTLMPHSVDLPAFVKNFTYETLLAKAQQLVNHPDLSFESVTADLGFHDPEGLSLSMQYAFAIQLLQDAALLHQLREKIWLTGHLKLCIFNQNQAQALKQIWPENSPLIQKISPELFLKFWQAKKSHFVDAELVLDENVNGMFIALQNYLQWQPKGRKADAWVENALHLAINAYLNPRIHRDILARCYDQAVEQLLPMLEVQWRQLLTQKSIGAHPILMFYPYGKSGVMIFLCDAQGEIIEDFTIYPHAPDYQIEESIAPIVKILARNNIEHIGWILQVETQKAILHILNTIQKRYPDLKWQLTCIPHQFSLLLNPNPKKAPGLAEVQCAGLFLQNPRSFWNTHDPIQILSPLLKLLPKERLQQLWHTLLQETFFISSHEAQQPFYPFLEEDQAMIENILELKQCDLSALLNDMHIIDSISHTPSFISRFGEDRIFRLQNIIWHSIQAHKPIYYLPHLQASLHDIKPGTRFYGTVTAILNYGCFVNLGNGLEGLLHISNMGDYYISDLHLIFQPGHTIIVEWIQYDDKQKRLSLRLFSEPLKKKKKPQAHAKVIQKSNPQKVEKKVSSMGPSAMALAFAKLKK